MGFYLEQHGAIHFHILNSIYLYTYLVVLYCCSSMFLYKVDKWKTMNDYY